MSEYSLPYQDGWAAHENGVACDDNPYNEKTQQASHNQWMKGWCARFSAIKHGTYEDEKDLLMVGMYGR